MHETGIIIKRSKDFVESFRYAILMNTGYYSILSRDVRSIIKVGGIWFVGHPHEYLEKRQWSRNCKHRCQAKTLHVFL